MLPTRVTFALLMKIQLTNSQKEIVRSLANNAARLKRESKTAVFLGEWKDGIGIGYLYSAKAVALTFTINNRREIQ